MCRRVPKGYLPDECKDIVEILQERWDNADVEDVLEEILENEDADEFDFESDDELADAMKWRWIDANTV